MTFSYNESIKEKETHNNETTKENKAIQNINNNRDYFISLAEDCNLLELAYRILSVSTAKYTSDSIIARLHRDLILKFYKAFFTENDLFRTLPKPIVDECFNKKFYLSVTEITKNYIQPETYSIFISQLAKRKRYVSDVILKLHLLIQGIKSLEERGID